MSDPELPPDLAAIERRLAGRPRIEPSPEFGARLLAASRDALHRPLAGRMAPPSHTWRSWASVAAAALLAINLSMSIATATDWNLKPAGEPGLASATVNRLRELAPDLPESELRRQVLLVRAGAGLAPAVDLTPTREQIYTGMETDRWEKR
jgi:hypothetical protein